MQHTKQERKCRRVEDDSRRTQRQWTTWEIALGKRAAVCRKAAGYLHIAEKGCTFVEGAAPAGPMGRDGSEEQEGSPPGKVLKNCVWERTTELLSTEGKKEGTREANKWEAGRNDLHHDAWWLERTRHKNRRNAWRCTSAADQARPRP